ncbi:hypothetical protein HU830_04555 [Lactobacillus sp. DCY120]|uniref:Transposase n=1 Tax=Bombilactobacillus apium TaxID=2675299 RepID=A0A850R0J5_9LACO|nr:hypothetical protein [Bombilactobacillus apium]NVY96443.1 hypothetical protein [Bombilactobacillus apium]
MKKVELSIDQEQHYRLIKRIANQPTAILTAAVKLDCLSRTIYRLRNKYWQQGKAAFVHGNTNHSPANKLPPALTRKFISGL